MRGIFRNKPYEEQFKFNVA